MTEITLVHYLILAAIIFTTGVVGIFLNRKNVIVILMSIELILLAVNINLVSFSIFLNDLSGQIFTLFILTIAAAEAAIGLAIIVVYYRNSGTIRVEEIDNLKGYNGKNNFISTISFSIHFWIFWKNNWLQIISVNNMFVCMFVYSFVNFGFL